MISWKAPLMFVLENLEIWLMFDDVCIIFLFLGFCCRLSLACFFQEVQAIEGDVFCCTDWKETNPCIKIFFFPVDFRLPRSKVQTEDLIPLPTCVSAEETSTNRQISQVVPPWVLGDVFFRGLGRSIESIQVHGYVNDW